MGKVFLVGSGPGDPGLITVRGRDLVLSCDCLVYDALASDAVVRTSRAREKIYVGKEAGRHALPQVRINELLVEKAAAHGTVVRLKGGDPFVFGRGGEEAEVLAARGVPFEIVPGVSSAIAAPAYAGIPVTHRGLASQVTFVTGHEDPTKEASDIDWGVLARSPGTLVFLMGVRNIPHIAERLVAEGRDAATPAAVVHRGTHPGQKTVVSTLGRVAADAADLPPPSVLVVGEVVRLRERISWIERRPLFGRRIVVTRSRAQASDLADRLADLGAEVIEVPTIRIEPPESWAPLDAAVRRLGAFDDVVLLSANGVESLFGRLAEAGLDARALAGRRVVAVGPATAARLSDFGIRPDLVPERFTAEGVLEAMGAVARRRVLVPRAAEGRDALPEGLERGGATVEVVQAYRTVREAGAPPEILEEIRAGRVDLVTFTSSSTVTNYLALFDAPPPVPAAVIGPVTARTAREAGLTIAVEAAAHTVPALVEAVVARLARPAGPGGEGAS